MRILVEEKKTFWYLMRLFHTKGKGYLIMKTKLFVVVAALAGAVRPISGTVFTLR